MCHFFHHKSATTLNCIRAYFIARKFVHSIEVMNTKRRLLSVTLFFILLFLFVRKIHQYSII